MAEGGATGAAHLVQALHSSVGWAPRCSLRRWSILGWPGALLGEGRAEVDQGPAHIHMYTLTPAHTHIHVCRHVHTHIQAHMLAQIHLLDTKHDEPSVAECMVVYMQCVSRRPLLRHTGPVRCHALWTTPENLAAGSPVGGDLGSGLGQGFFLLV